MEGTEKRCWYCHTPGWLVYGSLAVTGLLFASEKWRPFAAFWCIRTYSARAPYPWVQVFVCLGVALIEVALGAWEIRRIVQECQKTCQENDQHA
jgi:hypothetical protein